MADALGFSVYLSTFKEQWPVLSGWAHREAPIFLSLNMGKGDADIQEAEKICLTLHNAGFRVIADVSTETCELFGEKDLTALAQRLKLWALRIDYGFSTEQIRDMAQIMPIVLNASTTDPLSARTVFYGGKQVFALHNFYPRPETGLDGDMLLETTRNLQNAGIKVQAFIPGDSLLRGPIYEGLPTLEKHRGVLPSAAFADLCLTYRMDDIFVGDPGISQKEQQRIGLFCEKGILSVPADLTENYQWLYDVDFTCRIDSPRRLIRLEESRTTYKPETAPQELGADARPRGTITIDNAAYGRYAGEIQILRGDFPAEARVNVIGRVPENAFLLLDLIRGGQKFRLVRP